MKLLDILFIVLGCTHIIPSVAAIYCHQCNSNNDAHCAEVFNPGNLEIYPSSCDHIHEARYCIKATGMYEGTIGTRRFCSSRHHGNYCEYIKRVGDDREYRSCVYTCYADGCNVANANAITFLTIITTVVTVFVFQNFLT